MALVTTQWAEALRYRRDRSAENWYSRTSDDLKPSFSEVVLIDVDVNFTTAMQRAFLLRSTLLVTLCVHYGVQEGTTNNALWTKYTDKITATCLRIPPAMRSLFGAMLDCIYLQALYLQCTLIDPTRNMPAGNFTTPCGWIVWSAITSLNHKWYIKVHPLVYLALTFHRFELPMPYGRCDFLQGLEHVIVSYIDRHSANGKSEERATYFCGTRSQFTSIWRTNELLVTYSSITGLISKFMLHYDVCKERFTDVTTEIITTSSVVNSFTEFTVDLKHFAALEMTQGKKKYFLYLMGARLEVLDLGLAVNSVSKVELEIHVFEGLEAYLSYEHPHTKLLLQDEWIYFVAFQGFVNIQCRQSQCGDISLHYAWQLVNFRHMIIVNPLSMKSPFSFCQRYYHSLMHCAFAISSQESNNVRLTHQKMIFEGPDYLGNLPEEHRCTLAGATIADSLRLNVLKGEEVIHLQTDGAISRDFVVDAIFPEITMCFNSESDGVRKRTFVSTGEAILIVLYAWEAYVDLTKYMKLTFESTPCVGITLGCYDIPGNGHAQIGYTPIHRWESSSMELHNICPRDKMMRVTFVSSYHLMDLMLQLVICTKTNSQLSNVVILSHLDDDEMCLNLQKPPYSRMKESHQCILEDRETHKGGILHEYKTDLNHLRSVYCAELTANVQHWRSVRSIDDKSAIKQSKLKYLSKCVEGNIEVSAFCNQHDILEEEPSDLGIQLDLNSGHENPTCHINTFAVIGNSVTNRLYVKQPRDLWALNTYLNSKERSELSELSKIELNMGIAFVQLTLNISVSKQCSVQCRSFNLHLAYAESVNYRIVVLNWQLHLDNGSTVIIVSQIPAPYTLWLLYVTYLANRNACNQSDCSAQVDTSDHTQYTLLPDMVSLDILNSHYFAQYVFMWVPGEYSWFEAEETCVQLGMHLASISSNEEYRLITGMLLGDGYGTESSLEPQMFTPCRTEEFVCMIYIGMHVKVTQFSFLP